MEPTTRTYKRLMQYVSEESWAILPSYLAIMRELLALRASGFRLSADEIAERIGAPEARTGPTSQSQAGIAVIPVWGVIGHRANELRDISSKVGTSTEVLGAQVDTAAADATVSAIVLDINSPGGGVFGVQEVADKIRSARSKKPIIAVANALSASAAYWIASAASELVVTPSGLVGAIGVFSIHEDHSAELANDGVAVSLIKAGKFKAEDNPFGPLTEEARANIQQRVDAFYAMFTRDVAKGRGVAIEAVRNGFGEGRVVDAKTAVSLGMADRVGTMEAVIGRLLAGGDQASTTTRIAAESVCPACNGSGLKPERFMSDPQGQETCDACGGSGRAEHAAHSNRPRIAAEEAETAEIQAENASETVENDAIPAEIAAAAAVGETPDVRQRRLKLRLLELGG